MRIECNLTPNQQAALLYKAADTKTRRKLKLPPPSDSVQRGLWHDGVLGAWWKRNDFSGTGHRLYFVPDDIKSQIDSYITPARIYIDLDNPKIAVLYSAARLWENGSSYFDRWHDRPTGRKLPTRWNDRWTSEKETVHYKLKVVPDRTIAKDTELNLQEVRDAIKWLDTRGFLIRSREQWDDAEDTAEWVMKILQGYTKKSYDGERKRDTAMEIEEKPHISLNMPERLRRLFSKYKNSEKNPYYLAYFNNRLRAGLELGDPGYLDSFGDDFRAEAEPIVMQRVAARLEEEEREGRVSESIYVYRFSELFPDAMDRFCYRASGALHAESEDSVLHEDIVRRVIEESLREDFSIGARFTPARIRRVKTLIENGTANPEVVAEQTN